MKHQGLVLETLADLKKVAEDNQKLLAQIPVLTTRQDFGLNRVSVLEADVTAIKLTQARQRGVMTVIGTGAGLLAGGFIDFFLGKLSGRH